MHQLIEYKETQNKEQRSQQSSTCSWHRQTTYNQAVQPILVHQKLHRYYTNRCILCESENGTWAITGPENTHFPTDLYYIDVTIEEKLNGFHQNIPWIQNSLQFHVVAKYSFLKKVTLRYYTKNAISDSNMTIFSWKLCIKLVNFSNL